MGVKREITDRVFGTVMGCLITLGGHFILIRPDNEAIHIAIGCFLLIFGVLKTLINVLELQHEIRRNEDINEED